MPGVSSPRSSRFSQIIRTTLFLPRIPFRSSDVSMGVSRQKVHRCQRDVKSAHAANQRLSLAEFQEEHADRTRSNLDLSSVAASPENIARCRFLPICRHHACTLLTDRLKLVSTRALPAGQRNQRVVAEGSICRSLMSTQRNRVRHALNGEEKPYRSPTAGWSKSGSRRSLMSTYTALFLELSLNFCFPDLFFFLSSTSSCSLSSAQHRAHELTILPCCNDHHVVPHLLPRAG